MCNKHVYLLLRSTQWVAIYVPQNLEEAGLILADPWRQQAAGSDTAIDSKDFLGSPTYLIQVVSLEGKCQINRNSCLLNSCELVVNIEAF